MKIVYLRGAKQPGLINSMAKGIKPDSVNVKQFTLY